MSRNIRGLRFLIRESANTANQQINKLTKNVENELFRNEEGIAPQAGERN